MNEIKPIFNTLDSIDLDNLIDEGDPLKQNSDHIIKFFHFLNHEKSVFQGFLAVTENDVLNKKSYASKEEFITTPEEVLSLCQEYQYQGVLCLGINQREKNQTKITDLMNKINTIFFDIDVKKKCRENGVAPLKYIKEAFEVGKNCITKLHQLGFDVDYFNFSGNGFHVGIKINIDIPPYKTKKEFEESIIYKKLIQLERELEEFETENVEIDPISKDIMRRIKIAGTYNVKRYKIGTNQFKLIPKKHWRKTKILYLNEKPNEEKNNKSFENLEIPIEDNEMDLPIPIRLSNINIPSFRELENYIKNNEINDQKLLDLYYDRLTNEFDSRSEAEFSLINKLIFYGYPNVDINEIMNSCQIGKWQEKNESYKDLTIEKSLSKIKDRFNWDVWFRKREKINKIDKLISELNENTINDNKIKEILKLIPKNNEGIKNKVQNEIANKCKHYGKQNLKTLLSQIKKKDKKEEKKPKKIPEELSENLEEDKEFIKQIIKEGGKVGKNIGYIYKILRHDHDYIIHASHGIWLLKITESENGENLWFRDILDGNLEILSMIKDINLNVDRFTFNFDKNKHFTKTVKEIIGLLGVEIYKGKLGSDIITKILKEKKKEFETNENLKTMVSVLGFDDGYKLPINEEKDNFTLIQYTDFDRQVYDRAKKIIKKYIEKKKKEIREDIITFLKITQTKTLKHLIVIGWAMASIFRIILIEFFNIFPHLYLIGKRKTGKSALEDFWIVNFFRIYDKSLPIKTVESESRLEDHLSDSTFPINIQEVDNNKDGLKKTLSIIKNHATDSIDFERKATATTLAVQKTEVAPLSFDSNSLITHFNDPATNSKMIIIFFRKNIKRDQIWRHLVRKLKREKLFSFVYEFTKDWNNDILYEILIRMEKILEEELKYKGYDLDKFEKENPRIIPIYSIIRFGLWILEQSFNIKLQKIFNNKIRLYQIFNTLTQERKTMTNELLNKFISFCVQAKNFQEEYEEQYTDKDGEIHIRLIKYSNPKHLTCKLRKDKDNKYYVFTHDNLRDFQEFMGRRYSLSTELPELLQDALEDKKNIEYKILRYFGKNPIGAIRIKKDFLNEFDF